MDDDDIYSGFDGPVAINAADLTSDEGFQEAVRTSYGRRPPMTAGGQAGNVLSAARIGTSAGFRGTTAAGRSSYGRMGVSSLGRPVTGAADGEGIARPMTAVRGAGYTSAGQRGPSGQGGRTDSPIAPLLTGKGDDGPEEKIRGLEKKVALLIEEAAFATARGDVKTALDLAKEASSKERSLIRQREQAGLTEGHNLDLTFTVLLNLACQYTANEMYNEALSTYQVIIKNRLFQNAGRLKVNVGNIYYKLGQYNKALKYFRMALDQVPNTHKSMRISVMRNIGLLFVKMGQYNDACTSFEYIMSERADFKTGLDLVVCYFALGDKDKMKMGFQRLLEIPLDFEEDEKYNPSASDDHQSRLILEVIKNDSLRKIERQRRQQAEKCIMSAAKLISPVIEDSFTEGYSWCVESIKGSLHADLADELEINKAVMYLKQKEFGIAIDTLKAFEKRDSKVASTAATNLSFLYYVQGDLEQAEKYALLGHSVDSYNPGALVNMGNVSFSRGDIEKAKAQYIEALECDASCVEALHNLGLANKKLNRNEEALDAFYKLQAILKNHPQVLYQIGTLHEALGDLDMAIEWFVQVLSLVPSDPQVLQKLGELSDIQADRQTAHQYHFDSYKYFPSNLDVLDWLSSYYIEHRMPEQAVKYCERAALMQPDEVKWQLMVASCQRRSGNYQQALETYKHIHLRFPDNIDCLKFLVRLCNDLGLKEAQEYSMELRRAEKSRDVKEARASSSRAGSRYGSGRSQSRQASASSLQENLFNRLGRAKSPGVRSIGSDISAGSGRFVKVSLAEFDDSSGAYPTSQKDVDASYSDPIGPLTERPKTSSRPRKDDDDFGDEELGDDLLPV
ncbi:unnamed protein product [Cyprideis torosa]|uniref:Uncharacterized protein n=1 Tax=Cyprideis torosa TaxID=163714 RepID=A0A7R8WK01_9CRUS|nr:unnamed protein product [Cyprideis torosa]CAG0895541.1 unnamed protein product [Cyprideis torosa]